MAQQGLIDSNLEKLIKSIQEQKTTASTARGTGTAVPWLRPPLDEWEGDLQSTQSLVDMHKAFNTDEAEESLIKAFTLATAGNSADGIVLSLQIDYASQMERAYRARHSQSFPRMVAHCEARELGHGQDTGAITGQTLDYFTSILQQGT